MDVPRSDPELVAQVVEGDEDALAVLYDRHAASVFRAAYRLLGDRGQAEEVLQETYLALWNRAELFDARVGSLVAWLSTIARNRSVDRLRATGRRPTTVTLGGLIGDDERGAAALDRVVHEGSWLGVRDRYEDPEQLVDADALRVAVGEALDQIPPDERRAIELAYYGELTQTEIAAHLDWPLGTVKTRTRRALGRLRRALAVTLGPELGRRVAPPDAEAGTEGTGGSHDESSGWPVPPPSPTPHGFLSQTALRGDDGPR